MNITNALIDNIRDNVSIVCPKSETGLYPRCLKSKIHPYSNTAPNNINTCLNLSNFYALHRVIGFLTVVNKENFSKFLRNYNIPEEKTLIDLS